MTAVLSTANRVRSHSADTVGADDGRALRGEWPNGGAGQDDL